MRELDRRTFCKICLTMPAGILASELMSPVKVEVNKKVEQVTGKRAGNAAVYQEIENACQNSANKQQCFQEYKPPSGSKVLSIFFASPSEELIFRGIPSALLSISEGRNEPISDMLTGTDGLGMTRRELGTGILSSLVFGAGHNVTNRGIDTTIIPASQTLGGMVYWYLQRKLGIVSNIVAHAWNNFRALT